MKYLITLALISFAASTSLADIKIHLWDSERIFFHPDTGEQIDRNNFEYIRKSLTREQGTIDNISFSTTKENTLVILAGQTGTVVQTDRTLYGPNHERRFYNFVNSSVSFVVEIEFNSRNAALNFKEKTQSNLIFRQKLITGIFIPISKCTIGSLVKTDNYSATIQDTGPEDKLFNLKIDTSYKCHLDSSEFFYSRRTFF